MSHLALALEEVAEEATADSLATFRKHLDQRWINEALEASGVATLRRRRLPAEQVVWLVLGMALLRDRPIAEVVERLDLALPGQDGSSIVAPSSVVQARKRVGPEPLQELFNRCANWAHDSARNNTWRGLALYGVDGTTLRVADSDENRAHFGLASGGDRGESAYPLVRMAALMALHSHLLARVSFGPYATGERTLCEALWAHIPDDSLTILDRNFLSAQVLLGLHSSGTNRHWLTRAKSNSTWEVVESYGRYDKVIQMKVSSQARRENPELPRTFTARAVSYKHPRSNSRQWLLSSLLDPRDAPAGELVALYHQRWEIEIGYDELKTHMLERQETIRSRTVAGVEQELWGILVTYNLIRFEMERIAEDANVSPSQISFVTAMRFIRDEWMWCAGTSPGAIPKNLKRMETKILGFVLPPRRSERSFPRAVKIKMSNYPKKRRKISKRAAK